MEELQNQVEMMIKEGKTDIDCLSQINTLKSILKMLQSQNIHKIDKESDEKSSEPPKEDIKHAKGSDNITETSKNVILKVQVKDADSSSNEFTSDSSTKKEN